MMVRCELSSEEKWKFVFVVGKIWVMLFLNSESRRFSKAKVFRAWSTVEVSSDFDEKRRKLSIYQDVPDNYDLFW